jgi:hypothetical protein
MLVLNRFTPPGSDFLLVNTAVWCYIREALTYHHCGVEANRMRKIIMWCLGIGLTLSAGLSGAQPLFTQNEFTTAESLDPGMTQTGIHFTLGDHYKNYYPEIRYGMGGMTEVGVKFGATTAAVPGSGDKLGALLGIDLKYQLVKETDGIPIDLSVDLGLDNTIINDRNASEVSFATIVSKSFPLTDRGYKFTPYGGLGMASLGGSLPQKDDKATSIYVFGGIEWKLSQKFMFLLELKTGPSTLGGAGIRFEY